MTKKSAAMMFLALAIAILPVSARADRANDSLGEAVLQNNDELFVLLLEGKTKKHLENASSVVLNNNVCSSGWHNLIQAIVLLRRYKMAIAYLEKGLHPNGHFEWPQCQSTALQLAIKMKDKRMINLLLKYGAK